MHEFNPDLLKKLYIPQSSSHKGENGKVLVIGGSHLFHAASLWALSIAAKIVDMVFYASVPENNDIVQKTKEEFRNGIVISRAHIDDYLAEADCVLIGPGLPREDGQQEEDDDTKTLTELVLKKYPHKRWVIDGGSIQTIDPRLLPKTAIITPHHKEFETLFKNESEIMKQESWEEKIKTAATRFDIVIISKGEKDIVCAPNDCVEVAGGNAGMTKGGTGDVLAGLTAALYAQNADPFLVACAASYINKAAGDRLFKRVGYYFNASDLVEEIPHVMKDMIL